MAKAFTSRNTDGKPRKLRTVTNERAARRQARKIVEARLGRELPTSEVVHHKDHTPLHNAPGNLTPIKGNKAHGRVHPGK